MFYVNRKHNFMQVIVLFISMLECYLSLVDWYVFQRQFSLYEDASSYFSFEMFLPNFFEMTVEKLHKWRGLRSYWVSLKTHLQLEKESLNISTLHQGHSFSTQPIFWIFVGATTQILFIFNLQTLLGPQKEKD